MTRPLAERSWLAKREGWWRFGFLRSGRLTGYIVEGEMCFWGGPTMRVVGLANANWGIVGVGAGNSLASSAADTRGDVVFSVFQA